MNLDALEGVGQIRSEALRAMGIFSLRDLLFTLPMRYEDHSTVFPCNTNHAGMILVCGIFQNELKKSFFRNISRTQGTLIDSSGKLQVCWYNMPWISNQIHIGETIRLFGRLTIKGNRRILQNPKIITDSGLLPVYKSSKHLSSSTFRNLIKNALLHLDDCCTETLPNQFRIRNNLCELNYAIRQAHFPNSIDDLFIARKRLTYEKVLLYLLFVSINKNQKSKANSFLVDPSIIEEYWKSLSFSPTGSQRRVMNDIIIDLKKPYAMARLVQGDVGCGKTAVAFGAAFIAFRAGFQCAMMAPTEILASQHFEEAQKILTPLGITCRLLTGSTKKKERNIILKELIEGECNLLIGTHALISNDIKYKNLGLVITDEQHRFGVNQRNALFRKGGNQDHIYPHVLVLSATPIPRTLALILYGDLSISVIHELPQGRKPVKTYLVPEFKREGMYRFLREQISAGKQAYIVCPSVEDSSEETDLHSAKALYDELKNEILHDLRIGLIWGSQKNDEKERVIRTFSDGEYDVLVATTVIEVGINNPNATIMIVENAERFGLSQLHQLRGRVGRGNNESWCFLMSDSSEKLGILCSTNDGFIISQKDLELRGPGDLVGTKQSGESTIKFLADCNAKLLEEVSNVVHNLYTDPAQEEILNFLLTYTKQYFHMTDEGVLLN